jgi:predicted esterase
MHNPKHLIFIHGLEGTSQGVKATLLRGLFPAILTPDFADALPQPVDVPVILYHGSQDQIIHLEPVRQIAERIFTDLDFIEVDDDHGLYKTVHEIDWPLLLNAD